MVWLLLLLAPAALAAEEKVLIPIKAFSVPGANGSVWSSQLAISNHSERSIIVGGVGPCVVIPCGSVELSPNTTIFTGIYTSLLGVDSSDALGVTFQLRVQDTSRQAQTWGTSIPAVRARDAFVGRTANLVDIPLTDAFRVMLRVYDFDPPVSFDPAELRQVKLRFYAVDATQSEPTGVPDLLLSETIETFVIHPTEPFTAPPTLSIPLWSIPELAGHERIRIELEPISPGLRFWAFASVTNNATQHVTVIVPQ